MSVDLLFAFECYPIMSVHLPTCRILKPFIRRDYETRPLKLRILEEIRSKCPNIEVEERPAKPIDYCYVQPHHIPAVNAICQEFFWTGIDGKKLFTFEKPAIKWFYTFFLLA